MSDDEARTDGGITEEDIFGTADDSDRAQTSPAERFQRLMDAYFLTPMRIAWDDWRARIGGIGLILYILMGTLGVMIVPAPELNEFPRYMGPFVDFGAPLGTDNLGRSIGKQIVHATPAMLKIALAGVSFSVGLGTLVGFISGYKGGTLDAVTMTFTDVFITLPGLPLIMVLASIFPPEDPFIVGMVLSIGRWAGLARTLRSQVLTLREEDFVEAARAMGLSTTTIIGQELIPKLAPYILVNAALSARGVIQASVGLYFLGILPFGTLNWGIMMNFAYQQGNAVSSPGLAGHWLLWPTLALSGLTFVLVLFSQGMDRVFNPRLRARHSDTAPDDGGEA